MLAMDLEELQNTCDGGGAGDAFASKNMMSLTHGFKEPTFLMLDL